MSKKPRDPRVEAIAAKLVEIQPYGKDFRKTEPSVADYHAALIAVRTLDEMAEFEYSIESHDLDKDVRSVDPFWKSSPADLETPLKRLRAHQQSYVDYGGYIHAEYKIVKRRKQGYVDA